MRNLIVLLAIILFPVCLTAQPYTITFDGSEADNETHTITKNIGGNDFTFSAKTFIAYDGNGLYGLDESSSNLEITIGIQNGYSFDINKLKGQTDSGQMQFVLTYTDNSTVTFNKTGISNSGLTEISGTDFPINNVKKVVVSASGYGVIQDIEVTDIQYYLPVELTSFTARSTGDAITLEWQTATEINNNGFDIERKTTGNDEWLKIGFVAGAGNSNSAMSYSFIDKNVKSGKYIYRLKQIDNDGAYSYSEEIVVETGHAMSLPTEYSLYQNYPNPFNPTTMISYQLPEDSRVMLKIYDMVGREVASLVNEFREAGTYSVSFDASKLTAGLYIAKLTAGKYAKSIKLSLIK